MSNPNPGRGAASPCEEREFELMEFVDGALADADAAALRRHLDGCARCRAFERDFRATSDRLAAALPPVTPAADFDARLHSRVAGLARTSRRDTALERAEREYRDALASLRRGLRWRTALNSLATASVTGGVCYTLAAIAPAVTQALGLQTHDLAALGAIGIAGLAVAGGAFLTRWQPRSGGWQTPV